MAQKVKKVKVKVAQSVFNFCNPMDWSGQPFPSPGDLPNPGVEPRSPALQEDSLPAEPQGKTSKKNLPAMWETWVLFLGWEDPLEKGKATHSSILAWRIPGTV